MVLSLNRQFSGAGWSECIEGVCCTSISLMNIERMNDIYICIVTSIVFISMSTPSFVILKLVFFVLFCPYFVRVQFVTNIVGLKKI
jgi:hypothetical protein